MCSLRVESNRDGWSLVIDETFHPDYYRAVLNCGTTQAAVEFYAKDVPPVSDLFSALAVDWRGWEGEHAWGSLDGEVDLRATHDKLGTVTLTVRLRSHVYTASVRDFLWTTTALLFLDAGGLDALARKAAQFTG
jgi:Family of unknown function (DUF6228)